MSMRAYDAQGRTDQGLWRGAHHEHVDSVLFGPREDRVKLGLQAVLESRHDAVCVGVDLQATAADATPCNELEEALLGESPLTEGAFEFFQKGPS
jgi:hypothetical protein